MELVYLWVEKYKNIHRQGFNFSPKFNCDYDPDSNELTIDKNDDHIENFFGDNINVTAIVGKNGSGKSSVLEFILDRLASRPDIYPKNFIFIYIHEKELYKYSNFEYKISSKINIEEYINSENLLNFYENTIAINMNSEYKNVEVRETQQIFSENNKYDKNSSNLVILENYIKNKKQLEVIKETFFTPHLLKISIKTRDNHSILNDDRDYYSDKDWGIINDLIESMMDRNFIDRLHIIDEIFKRKFELHTNKNKFIFGDRNSPNKYRQFNDELLKNVPDIFKNNKKESIEVKIEQVDSGILEYIGKLPYIYEIDLIDENKINIDSLSFGEKQLLIQLHYILSHASHEDYIEWVPSVTDSTDDGEIISEEDEYEKINEVSDVLIFLDEFELGLHPLWQKKSIDYIVSFLNLIKDKKFQIILTSHSPFLLSDIPKQNIIFLDKDENGKCKVVDGLKDKKQTFGANIHTLLSDSFFMEDGLMGEFAKGKINKAIGLLNQDSLSDDELKYCEQIISIIGEPIVKNQLQRMLDSKKISYLARDTKEEIEFLKHRIDLLSKRL